MTEDMKKTVDAVQGDTPIAQEPLTGDSPSAEEKVFEDSYVFNNYVLEKIAGIAAREIKGILSLKGNIVSSLTGSIMDRDVSPAQGVSVDVGDEDVVVRVKMILEYGAPAPKIFNQLREHMGEQIKVMTGLNLAELNVEVVDVMTQEEFEQASQTRFPGAQPQQRQYVNRWQQDESGLRGGYTQTAQQQQPSPQQQNPQGYYSGQNPQPGDVFEPNF